MIILWLLLWIPSNYIGPGENGIPDGELTPLIKERGFTSEFQ